MRTLRFVVLLTVSLVAEVLHAQGSRRSLDQLINKAEPAWPQIQEAIAQATNTVEVLPAYPVRADSALLRTQVTTRSPLGAVVHGTGGILVDHGWVRILGCGSARLQRELMPWNKGKSFKEFGDGPSFLLVADDAAGGFFAINNGALDPLGRGHVFYWGTDDPVWRDTGSAMDNCSSSSSRATSPSSTKACAGRAGNRRWRP